MPSSSSNEQPTPHLWGEIEIREAAVDADADASPRRKLGCPLFQNSNKSDCPNTDRNYNNNQIKSTQIKDYSISDNPTQAANFKAKGNSKNQNYSLNEMDGNGIWMEMKKHK